MNIQNENQFQETLKNLEERVLFFASNHISAQNQLPYVNSGFALRSLVQIYPTLRNYSINETPLQPQLADIYSPNHQNFHLRYILPPPSDGENSINQQQNYDPTFKWLSNSIIDSTSISIDQIQPKKVQKGHIPPQWFQKYPWVKIKRIKQFYFKGKPSLIIKLIDNNATLFTYFNLVKGQTQTKLYFGQNSQIYRITQNRLKNKIDRWVGILFRKIPFNFTKQTFLSLLKKNQLPIIWLQQLIQIGDYKYTLCRVNYLQQAFAICSFFQTKKPIKDLKVNLHPRSTKTWKKKQQISIIQ